MKSIIKELKNIERELEFIGNLFTKINELLGGIRKEFNILSIKIANEMSEM